MQRTMCSPTHIVFASFGVFAVFLFGKCSFGSAKAMTTRLDSLRTRIALVQLNDLVFFFHNRDPHATRTRCCLFERCWRNTRGHSSSPGRGNLTATSHQARTRRTSVDVEYRCGFHCCCFGLMVSSHSSQPNTLSFG